MKPWSRRRQDQPGRLKELLRAAAASEPDPARRIGFLLLAQDRPRAAAELCEQRPGLLANGATLVVQHLLERLPDAERNTLPDAQRASALHGWTRWDWAHTQKCAGATTRCA